MCLGHADLHRHPVASEAAHISLLCSIYTSISSISWGESTVVKGSAGQRPKKDKKECPAGAGFPTSDAVSCDEAEVSKVMCGNGFRLSFSKPDTTLTQHYTKIALIVTRCWKWRMRILVFSLGANVASSTAPGCQHVSFQAMALHHGPPALSHQWWSAKWRLLDSCSTSEVSSFSTSIGTERYSNCWLLPPSSLSSNFQGSKTIFILVFLRC